jgi:hypothetical protein
MMSGGWGTGDELPPGFRVQAHISKDDCWDSEAQGLAEELHLVIWEEADRIFVHS